MKKHYMGRAQQVAFAPLQEAISRAVDDETLLGRIFVAMGPYAFNGTPQDPKAWEECLRALRDRFGFDDSE